MSYIQPRAFEHEHNRKAVPHGINHIENQRKQDDAHLLRDFLGRNLIVIIRACPRLFFVSRIHFHKLRMYSHNLIYSIVLVHFITAVSVRYIRPIILF